MMHIPALGRDELLSRRWSQTTNEARRPASNGYCEIICIRCYQWYGGIIMIMTIRSYSLFFTFVGLQFLHSRGIISCQVIPNKIVLANGRLCISDLGRSIDVTDVTCLPLKRYLIVLLTLWLIKIKRQLFSCRSDHEALQHQFPYIAPELCSFYPIHASQSKSSDSISAHLTYKSDFWSFGILLFEMSTATTPYPAKSFDEYKRVREIFLFW